MDNVLLLIFIQEFNVLVMISSFFMCDCMILVTILWFHGFYNDFMILEVICVISIK